MLSEQDTMEILAKFPPVDCAFAYGSGAVTQGGYKYTVSLDGGKDLPMLVGLQDSPYTKKSTSTIVHR
jgi:hypothetical protein